MARSTIRWSVSYSVWSVRKTPLAVIESVMNEARGLARLTRPSRLGSEDEESVAGEYSELRCDSDREGPFRFGGAPFLRKRPEWSGMMSDLTEVISEYASGSTP